MLKWQDNRLIIHTQETAEPFLSRSPRDSFNRRRQLPGLLPDFARWEHCEAIDAHHAKRVEFCLRCQHLTATASWLWKNLPA
jgi:hypothetical protein